MKRPRIEAGVLLTVAVALGIGLPVASGKVFGIEVDDPDPGRFEEAIARFGDEAVPPGGVLFVGSSSIRRWDLERCFPGLGALNRGFGGSQLSDAVHYADQLMISCRPRLILLYEGDNDIAFGKSPSQIRDDFRELADRVLEALPETHLVFLTIKPSPARWERWPVMRETNRLIAEVCETDDRLEVLDVGTALLGDNGQPRAVLYREDGLHLNEAGYDRWSSVVRPRLGVEKRDSPIDRPGPFGRQ